MPRLILKDYFYLFCLFFCSLALFTQHLSTPAVLYWDELIHINGARTILYAIKPYGELTQTPLGRELLVLSMHFFGDQPLGWRLLTAISASFNIVLVYGIAKKLFNYSSLAVLSSFFLLTDTLYYVQARIGMVDQFLTFFILLSFLLFVLAASEKPSLKLYIAIGFTLACAIAIKSIAVIFLPLYVFPLLKDLFKKQISWRRASLLSAFLIFPIPVVLWISYALIGFSFQQMLDHLTWLWGFLRNFEINQSITSSWVDWLRMEKPIWYLYQNVNSTTARFVLLTANPVFWYLAEFCFVALLFCWKKIPAKFFYLHAAVIGQFIFWSIKPSTHLYYMLPVLPFYALLIGAFFYFLGEGFPKQRGMIVWNAAALWLISLACFIYYFPLLQGDIQPLSILQRFPGLPP